MSAFKNLLRLSLFVMSLLGALATLGQDLAADRANIAAFLTGVERAFAAGDIDAAMTAFTDDAIIYPANDADISGSAAIRAAYSGMLTAFNVELSFDTKEVDVAGDLAYEQGLFTLKLTDKASGQIVSDTTSRHIHMLKRQPDGTWKTWRMMSNSALPPATP